MMHAASREALLTLRGQAAAATGSLSSAQLIAVAGELYSVTELLSAEPRLRRALGETSTPAGQRQQLASSLLRGKISDSTLQLVVDAIALGWSASWDLVDGIEQLGDESLFAAAEADGTLDDVEDELFRFERVLDAEPRLVGLLDERIVPAPARVGLLREVLGGKVLPITQATLEHAIVHQRAGGIENAIDDLLDAAARRRERSVARVTSGVELTPVQQQRLAAVLGEMYGRQISVRAAVEPEIQGGLVVRVDGELIDGSIAAQLAAARTALTA